ncbi:uncharacterized protein TNCV_2612161 [Trichonephila clavipes]|nr:uncharacterized protein TNCV_2612161 [Trichonephila clavipes]
MFTLGLPVVKVSEHDRHVMSSSSVPIKTSHVGERCTLNLSRAQTSSRWYGVVFRRGGCQFRRRPRGTKLRGPSPNALM